MAELTVQCDGVGWVKVSLDSQRCTSLTRLRTSEAEPQR